MDLDRRVLIAIVAAALLFRLPGLDSGLWLDELWLVAETIRASLGTLVTSFVSDNDHPLYSLSAWGTVRLFGESAWALRLPALLFGAASIGMLWVLAQQVTSRRQAAVVTALMTVSYHHVWFSQNARGYTMLLFWTLAATHFLIRAYREEGDHSWIAYAVCMALATYTQATAVLVALSHGLLALVMLARAPGGGAHGGRRKGRARWLPLGAVCLAGMFSLLLHASILPDMLSYFLANPTGGTAGESVVASEWNSPWWAIRTAALSLGLGLLPGLAVAGLAAGTVVVGILDLTKRDWRVAFLFVVPVVMTAVVTMSMGRALRPRILFSLGGFVLILTVGGVFAVAGLIGRYLDRDGRRDLRATAQNLAAVGMLALSLVILPRAYLLPKQDFRGALDYLESDSLEARLVLTVGPTALAYRDYYGLDYPELETMDDLDRFLATAGEAYVLYTLPIYLESRAPALARRLAAAEEVARFPGSLEGGDVLILALSIDDPR